MVFPLALKPMTPKCFYLQSSTNLDLMKGIYQSFTEDSAEFKANCNPQFPLSPDEVIPGLMESDAHQVIRTSNLAYIPTQDSPSQHNCAMDHLLGIIRMHYHDVIKALTMELKETEKQLKKQISQEEWANMQIIKQDISDGLIEHFKAKGPLCLMKHHTIFFFTNVYVENVLNFDCTQLAS